jgi:hypothetical protein
VLPSARVEETLSKNTIAESSDDDFDDDVPYQGPGISQEMLDE